MPHQVPAKSAVTPCETAHPTENKVLPPRPAEIAPGPWYSHVGQDSYPHSPTCALRDRLPNLWKFAPVRSYMSFLPFRASEKTAQRRTIRHKFARAGHASVARSHPISVFLKAPTNKPLIGFERRKWPRRPYTRLIRLATYPAPNPLSIFTTDTLLAQLVSIPNSAASP